MIINTIIAKILKFPKKLSFLLSPIYNRIILSSMNVTFGDNLKAIGFMNVINKGNIYIGKDVCITSGLHSNPICGNLESSWLIDKGAVVNIGNKVGMSSTRMWIHDYLKIGDNVHIGANVLLIDTDTHQLDYILRRDPDDPVFMGMTTEEIWNKKEAGTKSAPIIIEDDVWIGAHAIVLKGVTIGARSIIGAGSIVTKDIPSDCVAAGNPCKIIRRLNP